MILGVLALSNMHIFMSHIHFKPTLSFKNTVRGPKIDVENNVSCVFRSSGCASDAKVSKRWTEKVAPRTRMCSGIKRIS
jgi:hypothetical protein